MLEAAIEAETAPRWPIGKSTAEPRGANCRSRKSATAKPKQQRYDKPKAAAAAQIGDEGVPSAAALLIPIS
jgi:hypothetical protein